MIRRRDLGDTSQSGPGWPPHGRNLDDLDRLLEQHGDDGTGYCKACCNRWGWQHTVGDCPTARYAAEAKRKLLAERDRR